MLATCYFYILIMELNFHEKISVIAGKNRKDPKVDQLYGFLWYFRASEVKNLAQNVNKTA